MVEVVEKVEKVEKFEEVEVEVEKVEEVGCGVVGVLYRMGENQEAAGTQVKSLVLGLDEEIHLSDLRPAEEELNSSFVPI